MKATGLEKAYQERTKDYFTLKDLIENRLIPAMKEGMELIQICQGTDSFALERAIQEAEKTIKKEPE